MQIAVPRFVFGFFCLFVSTSLLAATPPALSNPSATPESHLGPQIHGLIGGQASVGAAGNASYIIPIDVPPGTNGMAPALSFNYHSNVQNGFMGLGWFVQGLTSKIQRCAQTIEQDGQNRAIDLSTNDRFCMDGHRLLAVSGTYGASGTEYRTESDEFSRIISHGGTTGNPSYWTVERKDGVTLTYGGTSDSKLEAPGESEHVVWCLDKTEDELGNYYTISYTRPATISTAADSYIRPDRIDYTGNTGQSLTPYASVQFEYEARDDIEWKYSLKAPIKVEKRFSNIKTYVGATLVRDYQLTYEYSASSERSRITSLEQCDSGNTCTESLDFSWSNDGVSFTQASQHVFSINNIEEHVFTGNFNGDGLTDAIAGTSLYHSDPNGSTGNFKTMHGNAAPFHLINDYAKVSGDFNGDGRDDLFFYPIQNGSLSAYVLHADANGVFSSISQEIEHGDIPAIYGGHVILPFRGAAIRRNLCCFQ